MLTHGRYEEFASNIGAGYIKRLLTKRIGYWDIRILDARTSAAPDAATTAKMASVCWL